MSDVAVIEWKGKEYELKYRFSHIKRLKRDGVNLPSIWRKIMADPESAMDYGDEIVYMIAWLLRDAGCDDVTDEEVWNYCMGDHEKLKEVMRLFTWIMNNHFSTSKDAVPNEKK